MRTSTAAAGAAALAVLLAACGGTATPTASQATAAPSPRTVTFKGNVILYGGQAAFEVTTGDDPACDGLGAFDLLSVGATVVVTDADGKKVGLGELDYGVPEGTRCRFPYTVPDVPDALGVYTVTIADAIDRDFTVKQYRSDPANTADFLVNSKS